MFPYEIIVTQFLILYPALEYGLFRPTRFRQDAGGGILCPSLYFGAPMSTEPDYNSLDPEERTNKYWALFSVAIGVISLCAALVPICGSASSLLGIGLGMLGLRSENRKMAMAGISISIIGLLISIIYSIMLFNKR
jgi:hypothetical protein